MLAFWLRLFYDNGGGPEVSQRYVKCHFDLKVRPIEPHEDERWKSLMTDHHYLGTARFQGEQIKYVATLGGEWCALLIWAAAALKLSARDEWIGWCLEHKTARLKYVSNNNRFLILPGPQIKNLASAILSQNLRRLSLDWQNRYGHPIFLAESFIDPARFSGSCYKACGWQPIGMSKGFSKLGPMYVHHGNKKIIFVKSLEPRARSILGGVCTHPVFFKNSFSFRRQPMIDANLIPFFGPDGLIEFAGKVPDGRARQGRRHRTVGMMILCLLATMSGAKTFKGIALWAKTLPLSFREKIHLWQIPSESTVRRFLISLDAELVDKMVYEWLLKKERLQGLALALDGKTIKRSEKEGKGVQLLSAVIHGEGLVVAQTRVDGKTNEIPVARELINSLDVAGAVITADAMHSQTETAETVKKTAQIMFS